MKKVFTVACLFMLTLAQAVLGDSNLSHYTSQGLEIPKAVQILGVQRNAENIEREDQVGKTLDSNKNQFRYCYEKALNTDALEVNAIIYFSVNGAGTFNNITADLETPQGSNRQNLFNFLSCISMRMRTFRAANDTKATNTFRFKVKFSSVQ